MGQRKKTVAKQAEADRKDRSGDRRDRSNLSPQEKKEQTEYDYRKMYESAMKDIAEKDQRITELESLIDEYVEGEERALQSIDEIVNERRRTIRKIKTSG